MKGQEAHRLTPHSQAVFFVKSSLLKGHRVMRDGLTRRLPQRPGQGVVVAEVITPLYIDGDPNERALQLGKVQNLRIAARAIDGTVMAAGATFSFWRQVGRPGRDRGYVEGRELRQGCLIPTIAGGLCQLSNSLYRAAREAGCIIVERHGHTAPIPQSPFPPGEDATVFWNYVDLRFRSQRPLRVAVRLDAESLIVRLETA